MAHLSPAILKAHHSRLALALEASGRSDPEVLAVHFQGAGEPERAAGYFAAAAARAAEALAFDRAAKLYRLALDSGTMGAIEGMSTPGEARGCPGQRRSGCRGRAGVPLGLPRERTSPRPWTCNGVPPCNSSSAATSTKGSPRSTPSWVRSA